MTALASYLDARANGGEWLLRIEDLDPLRETQAAAEQIVHSLEMHGFVPDEPVCYQSRRHALYRQRLLQLQESGRAYRCSCSRKALQANGGRHPNQCHLRLTRAQPAAIRFAGDDRSWSWDDLLLGRQSRATHSEIDDFVLQRKEGFFAYQLAVVTDDIEQKISHVVRGSDLLDSTPLQLALYESFGAVAPEFMHLPVVTDENGHKLSKQTFAPAIDDRQPGHNLATAFAILKHPLPSSLAGGPPAAQLEWGARNWQRGSIPAVATVGQTAPHL